MLIAPLVGTTVEAVGIFVVGVPPSMAKGMGVAWKRDARWPPDMVSSQSPPDIEQD